ncbi:hypothetical protein [Hydrogenophaga sp.]|nr:hypothetical protein [Hydrogenophaga sp.]MDO8903236.1 hypothetical protein [Hydrogenophaga sp.]
MENQSVGGKKKGVPGLTRTRPTVMRILTTGSIAGVESVHFAAEYQ